MSQPPSARARDGRRDGDVAGEVPSAGPGAFRRERKHVGRFVVVAEGAIQATHFGGPRNEHVDLATQARSAGRARGEALECRPAHTADSFPHDDQRRSLPAKKNGRAILTALPRTLYKALVPDAIFETFLVIIIAVVLHHRLGLAYRGAVALAAEGELHLHLT